MPTQAIIGAALNTAAVRTKGLWLAGTDVIAQPTTPPTYAVPMESVRIDHQGPGGVSSMDFDVECYTVPPNVPVSDGMEVRFYNFTDSEYLFYGFVDHVDIVNLTGSRGTVYHVTCVGIEAVLDWSQLAADLTVPAGLDLAAAVQSVFANCTGTSLYRIRSFATTGGTSNDTTPIASGGITLQNAITISAGTTLREGIRSVVAQAFPTGSSSAWLWTIDFQGNLRLAQASLISNWDFFAVNNDTAAGTGPAESLSYGIDAAQYHAVLVKGTGVTAFVSDGTGKEGPIATLNDASITTVAQAQAAGLFYLNGYSQTARGSFERQDRAPQGIGGGTPYGKPGGGVFVTDTRLGLSAVYFTVKSVQKTFNPSQRENWTLAFGGLPPSVASLARQLTRDTRS